MKKITTLFAAAMLTLSMSAQTVSESKTLDNVYVGVNAGLATKATHNAWLKNMNPNFGVRVGRNFTPVFGLAVESNLYFKNTNGYSTGTFINAMNTSLLGTVNLNNWIGGYKGEPRFFEVYAVYGMGWGHVFSNKQSVGKSDCLTSKVAADFAFNLGSSKAWQLYVEPSLIYSLNDYGYSGIQYNINRARFQLNVGVNYKFKNSNGTHNFVIAPMKDQAEIDALNAQINSLRSDMSSLQSDMSAKENECKAALAAKDKAIADLQQALKECNERPAAKATVTNLQPTVLFGQGRSTVDAAQYAPIELIANYMKNHKEAKVEIKGYASPEGNPEVNARISQARADAVKNILVKKYKIAADRLIATGMGATDELFEQVEFNRVATFNDITK